ncbi:hypothetical protein LCGC14_1434530 [marine sediment metagenome]|uniref:Uncharacterized protein n=1 Tax=marine sediment metagenome TaxID=412755 RepID=A0A0F9M338_9ZZZZ
MKRLTTFIRQLIFLLLLIPTLLAGQKVLIAYDANTPLNVTESCEFWFDGYDANSFTLDGTSVDQWDDKSGNDRHVLNGNDNATRPTYNSATGRVTFINANSTFLQSAAFGSALSQPNTIFVVYKITGGLADNEGVFDAVTSIAQLFYFHATVFKIHAGAQLVGPATNTNDNIHVGEFNGLTSNYWINGDLVDAGAIGASALDGITLGARGGLTTYADCEIMEVIGYNAVLTDADRDKITGYLSNKWNITATTDYKGSVLTFEGKVLTYTPSVFGAEYQAVYDAYTTKPDAATAAIWNTCVETWVANGEWATKDIIYVYAAHTNGAGEALINWKTPGTFDATAFNAPTFTADEGFLGNGTTQYINTGGWIPSVNGVNYLQDDASQIIYIRTDISGNTLHGIHHSGNPSVSIIPRLVGDAYISINDNADLSSDVNANGSGMFINTRTASNVKKLYRNKVAIINAVTASTSVPILSPYCLAGNNNNVADLFRVDQVSMYAWGAGMTQTHVNNFTDPFETAMDALGTGIIAMTELDILMKLQYMAFQLRIQNEKVPVYINP